VKLCQIFILTLFIILICSSAFAEKVNFTEKEISYKSGQYEIKGTLTLPANLKEKAPAILFLTGSGPQPRDGIEADDKTGIPAIYKILATGLAKKGIITLRCDDRIYLLKKKLSGDELIKICLDLTLNEEYIEDAVNGYKFLKEQPEVDNQKIYILGHSLGGFAAPFAAEQMTGLAGVILLAPGGEKIFDSMIRQSRAQVEYYEKNFPGQIPKEQMDEGKKQIAEMEKIEKQVYDKTLPKGQFVMGATDKYYYDLYGRDVYTAARNLKCPILHLWGEYDPNVTKKDYDNWNKELKSKKDYKTVTFPGLNHYFYSVDQYYPIGLTIVYEKSFDEKVLDSIYKWICGK
jgi:hypothetical protein